jgi:UEV domain
MQISTRPLHTFLPSIQSLTSTVQSYGTFSFPNRTHPCQSAHDDGRTQLLLCVHGLVPVLFRQVSYNIPIAIWITKDYPLQPPIVYVVPTSDMLVKAGKFVDVSGRINIEYIQQWERKSEVCPFSHLLHTHTLSIQH